MFRGTPPLSPIKTLSSVQHRVAIAARCFFLCLCLAAPTLASTIKPGLTVQQASDRLDLITCTLARAFNEGRLHADQYVAIFALRTEAAESVTRCLHLTATGDPRALAAWHEAEAACAVLEMAVAGIEVEP